MTPFNIFVAAAISLLIIASIYGIVKLVKRIGNAPTSGEDILFGILFLSIITGFSIYGLIKILIEGGWL